jgi:hypothetical protein
MSEVIRRLSKANSAWTPGHEKSFQSWYAAWAKRTGMHPNPDDPEHKYDYRSSYRAGSQPDSDLHWPSEYKHDDHPNRFIDGVDTRTGRPR